MCRLHQQSAASSLCSDRKMHSMNRDFHEVHIMSIILDHYVYFHEQVALLNVLVLLAQVI